jgi:hypothetical protein
MRIRVRVAIAATLAVAVVAGWMHLRPVAKSGSGAATVTSASIDSAGPEAAGNGSAASGPSAQRTAFVEPAVVCGDNAQCLAAPTTARSAPDAAWLAAHGYPTHAESQRLAALPETQLRAEAERGSLTATTALAERLLGRGDNAGLELLTRAADRGSIHAYYVASQAALSRRGSGGGAIEAGAYLRVAQLLGDHKAVDAFYRFQDSQGLGMAELRAIDLRSGALYQSYARNRRPTPRPL